MTQETMPERPEVMAKMPSQDEFLNRAMRLGVLGEDGSVDFAKLDELGSVPQDELN